MYVGGVCETTQDATADVQKEAYLFFRKICVATLACRCMGLNDMKHIPEGWVACQKYTPPCVGLF